jgi:DNA-binding response OmpR family regulator
MSVLVVNEHSQPLNVFLVEDQPMLASTLTDALTTSGIAVVGHAFDVPAAFAWLDRGLIADVALVDIVLPSGPAYTILDRLRIMDTATLLITALDRERIPSAYRNFAYLEKPFGTRELLEAVAAVHA